MTGTAGFWENAIERQAESEATLRADLAISRRANQLSAMTGMPLVYAREQAAREVADAEQAAEAAAEKSRFRAAAGNPSHLQDEDADTCPFCGSPLFVIGTRPATQERSFDPTSVAAQHRDPRVPATYHVRCSNFGCRYPLPVGDAAIGGASRRPR